MFYHRILLFIISFQLEICETHQPIAMKFCTSIELYNAGPKFRGVHPKNILGPKTCKIWPNFGRL